MKYVSLIWAGHRMYEGLEVGDKVRLRGSEWTVVGRFGVNGGATENALLTDADTLESAMSRHSLQAVTVVLNSAQEFDRFVTALNANPSINVDVKRETEWVAQQSKGLTGLVDFISYFVGTVMAIGASLGALNVMYSIIDGRKREIATLRAIGFGAGPIIVSVLLESLLLAVPGAFLGVLLAWLWFNGDTVSPVGISFQLAVTPRLALLGVIWALVIGLIGGFLPALRAARVPVATALRAT